MMQSPYFVLKPTGKQPHAIASRNALRAYARSIRKSDPQKASDILAWVGERAKAAADEGLRTRRVAAGTAGSARRRR